MHYPAWYVPLLTSPMLIAAIAILHVLVSHYAVGGGIFLALETRHAYRTNNREYLAYLKDHAWFFILITVVYGAITGVGIWWTIGLASPLATETLIHTFVFGWAMEYVFFVLEIISAFIFFYYWGRLEPKVHQAMAWIYAFSAWMSLVLITGITAFMLNPGAWVEHKNFWVGFFNPQFVPQTLVRTGGSLLLATLYVLLHASLRVKDSSLRNLVASRSAQPALIGAALVTVGAIGWFVFLPESARAAIAAAGTLNIFMVLIVAATIGVFAMLYLGPYRNPSWVTPGFAIVLFGMGLVAFSAGEFVREAVRKPYIIYNVIYSNQILPEELPTLREKGYLEGGTWTSAWVRARYPDAVQSQQIDEQKLLALPEPNQRELGRVLFQYHCSSCHATRDGYVAVSHLLRGWTPEMIKDLVQNPEKYRFFMPPWAGTPEEAELLTKYLLSITPPRPGAMK